MFQSPFQGSAADNDAEIDRNACNAAFHALGLRWCWDADTYRALQTHATERERLLAYLQSAQPHLLRAYDADFLIDAIEQRIAACRDSIRAQMPAARPYFDWSSSVAGELGA